MQRLEVKPEIDLFASRLNYQFSPYVAYRPDPAAIAINAFSVHWSARAFYAFPPFSVIPSVLHKIITEEARGVLVVPDWPSQPWYPKLASMLVQTPVLLSARNNMLILPTKPEEKHRLRKSLRLIICEVSGKDSDAQDFRKHLRQSCAHHGEVAQVDCTPAISHAGRNMQIKGVSIPFIRM